jgi:hypothetical protein
MRGAVVLLVVALAGLAGATPTPPWPRTETRAPCTSYTPLRAPYFGDLHVHTSYSADAYIFGTRVAPTDAYAFARGATIPLSDDQEQQTRTATLDRPLDFTAVTDHSEWYGETRVCTTSASGAFDLTACQDLRRFETDDNEDFTTTVEWLFPAGIANPPQFLPLCSTPGVDCGAARVSVWQDIQAAAEGAYDRTDTCTFTSFIGYEYTASPLGKHLHRNVIFRNEHVPPAAMSFLDTSAGGTPQGLWSAVETQCLHAGTGCDALIIPHNSNLSGGEQFKDPADAAEAFRRQTLEPLVEIHQIKGNSECRFDRIQQMGLGTNDELCSFEQLPWAQEGPAGNPVTIDKYPRRNMVRNTLEDGLGFEQTLGVNPFRFGFTGSTDNHDGTPGNVAEVAWVGGQGRHDGSPAVQIANEVRTNPGGLTVVWAEENSRDALFEGLHRRETYATSGTRPVVRFFGGNLRGVACGQGTLVHDAYVSAAPMGGEIGPERAARSPRFVIWATKDPGGGALPATDLQRVQIVKGWVDKDGTPHEQVYDVAGNANNGADVDHATCAPTGTGAADLCTVWTDPAFKRRERAFYYARVVENPTCRWTTRVCKAAGVDPFAADCAAQAATAGSDFANCCLGPANDASIDPVVQERAWTSPIWYRPEGVARLVGRVQFGTQPATDQVTLHVTLGGRPGDLDVTKNAFTLRVSDAADLFAVTVPAGQFRQIGPGRYTFTDRTHGLRTLSLAIHGHGAVVMTLRTQNLDLSAVDRGEHMVHVEASAGNWRVAHDRLWTTRSGGLVTGVQ